MSFTDSADAPPPGRAMRLEALHYGVAWRANRWRWAPEAFPAEVVIPEWALTVVEHRITVRPTAAKVYDESRARAQLEPFLDAWSAELAVLHNLPMAYWFLSAQMVPDVPIVMSSYSELSIGDFVGLSDELNVSWTRHELPRATWTRPPTSWAQDAREYCLLPMRDGRRQEADAAYWLIEHTAGWAGTLQAAASRLNLSHGVLARTKKLSGRAFDRKAAPNSSPLTAEELAFLRRIVELVVLRMHQYEVGEPIREHITADRV